MQTGTVYFLPLCGRITQKAEGVCTVQPEDIQAIFVNAGDFEQRTVLAGGQMLTAFFIDGLTSGGDIAEYVLRPLGRLAPGPMQAVYDRALCGGVWCASVSEAETAEAAAQKLVNGFCVMVFPGLPKALCFETKTGEKRGISAPEAENTVRGAKDAFTETVRTNTSLLRRHLLDMGLTPGIGVRVRKVAPMGDPIQIELRGYELTLRLDDARFALIEPAESLPQMPVPVEPLPRASAHPGIGEVSATGDD